MEKERKDKGIGREIDWDWWKYNVAINFLPLLASILCNLLQYNVVDIPSLIGSAEIVMCAFLILLPPMRESRQFSQKSAEWKRFSDFVWLLAFMELVSYGSIKANPQEPVTSVYVLSALYVVLSIVAALLSRNLPKGA